MLVAVRGRFHAVPDPRSRWRALKALLGFAATGFALGLVEIGVRTDRLVGAPGVAQWIRESAYGLLGISGPLHFARPLTAEAVSITTGTFGLLAVVAAAVLLLQSRGRHTVRTEVDDQRLRDLLRQYGGNDSLGYFRAPGRQGPDLGTVGRGRHRVPGRARCQPRRGRPDRGRGGMAGSRRRLARRLRGARLDTRGPGLRPHRRHRLPAQWPRRD